MKKLFFCCCKELTTYPKSVSNQNMKQHAAYLTKSCKYCFCLQSEKELPENAKVSENQDHSIRKFVKNKDHIRTIASKILGKYKDHY